MEPYEKLLQPNKILGKMFAITRINVAVQQIENKLVT
jgi:hypothetical protein